MSLQKSQILSSIRTLCGGPPDLPLPDGLPSELIFEEINNYEAVMLRDLDLGQKNRRVTKVEYTLTSNQEDLPISETDFHAPAYVYLRTDSTNDLWSPVDIVEQSTLPEAAASQVLAIAFSETPQVARFSWMPEGSHTLRIWYERAGNDRPSLDDTTEIGSLYDEYLKTQVAAQCIEHMGKEIGPMLQTRLNKSEGQWKRYVSRSSQRGAGFKARSFTPPRYRNRSTGVDRTRFFVP
jgi:hypothetical protein